MPVNIHVLAADPVLKPWKKALVDVARSTVERVEKRIPLDEVDLVFSHDPAGAVREVGGVGGYTPDAWRVLISLDPECPGFKESFRSALPGTIAHELHHASRWEGPGYGETLSEALVTEGLADHFVMEALGTDTPFLWTQALTKSQKEHLLRRARQEFRKSYNHEAWFFGSKQRRIPRWTGYALGFEMVKTYLEQHPEVTPSKLVHARAEKIIKP